MEDIRFTEKETNESVAILKYLVTQLQQTNNFDSNIKAQWIIELNEMAQEIKKITQYKVVQPPVKTDNVKKTLNICDLGIDKQ